MMMMMMMTSDDDNVVTARDGWIDQHHSGNHGISDPEWYMQ